MKTIGKTKPGIILRPCSSHYMNIRDLDPLKPETAVDVMENTNYPNDYIVYYNCECLGLIPRCKIQLIIEENQ